MNPVLAQDLDQNAQKLGPEGWAATLPDPLLPWGVREETSTENTPT
jgi:hypothetical protein